MRNVANYLTAPDDTQLINIIRDVSGGINTRAGKLAQENQVENLNNIDIGTFGKRLRRPGSVLIGDDKGNTSVLALHNYTIQGSTDQLLMYSGTALRKWEGSGNWADIKTDFTAGSTACEICSGKSTSFTPDDIVLLYNGADNVYAVDYAGNTYDLADDNTSPPKTYVFLWYGNRFWGLKEDGLYYSGAYPEIDPTSSKYGAFNRSTNVFRIPVGEERNLIASREFGIVAFGENAIWSLNPSVTPAATDQPMPLISDFGAVSRKAVINAGDDIYFFAQDGLRALKRNIQDKLQVGASYPISYQLKDEFARINWAYKTNISMESFDNKIFISVPISETAFDVWIYYPATQGFSIIEDAWHPTCFSKYKVAGDERLYYGKLSDTTVYRAWYGYTDEGTTTSNGTAIALKEIGKRTDFDQPLIEKVGGEIDVEAQQTDSTCSLKVEVKADDGSYTEVGTLVLTKDSIPTLDQTLPFNLASGGKRKAKYKIGNVGKYGDLQYKLTTSNIVSGDIEIDAVKIVTFPNEYQGE